DDCGLTFLHVFPYSERPGTPAARMPPVPVPVRKDRAARLRAAGAHVLTAYLEAQVGRDVAVLVEAGDIGRTEHFATVRLDRPAAAGALVHARLTGVDGDRLTGQTV
ncbi:MAG: tRNA (N(6)-L-threonylcarbamoyladenosine(37)-C(2))-methylthiotransferase MtaB, partial [Alphaproteobacteria bacterium]